MAVNNYIVYLYMNIDQVKELLLGLVLWIFGWTLFEQFLAINKFDTKTKFIICLVGFSTTLCLFYHELDDSDSDDDDSDDDEDDGDCKCN